MFYGRPYVTLTPTKYWYQFIARHALIANQNLTGAFSSCVRLTGIQMGAWTFKSGYYWLLVGWRALEVCGLLC